MIAMQRRPPKPGGERIERIELTQPDSARAHPLEQTAPRQHRAPAVVNYVDLHALLLLGDQRVREPLSDFTALENVRFQVDVARRALDCAEHRLVCRRAVLQQGHLVPRYQRTPADSLLDREMAPAHVGLAAASLEPLDDQFALTR